jgi:hypothetical protein
MNDNMHLLRTIGSATASSGTVGLNYLHLENVTSDAKQKGGDLLAESYQTYVVDDAEFERVGTRFY